MATTPYGIKFLPGCPCCEEAVGNIILRKYGPAASSSLSWNFRREAGAVSGGSNAYGLFFGGSATPSGFAVAVRASDDWVAVGGTRDINNQALWLLNASGAVQWSRGSADNRGYAPVRHLLFSADGLYLYVAYQSILASSSSDGGLWVEKLDASDGSLVWEKRWITATTNTGTIGGMAIYDGDLFVAGGDQSGSYLAKRYAGSDGTVAYSILTGGSGDRTTAFLGVAIDSTGEVFWAGQGTSSEPWLIHADDDGNVLSQWPKVGATYHTQNFAGIAVDSADQLIVTGTGIRQSSGSATNYRISRWTRTTVNELDHEEDFAIDWGIGTSLESTGRVALDDSDRIFVIEDESTADQYAAYTSGGTQLWTANHGQPVRGVAASGGGSMHVAGDGVA